MTKTITNEQEQARIEAIKKRGFVSAFDCMFHASQLAKKQNKEQLTTAEKNSAQVSQNQKPARRKRHSAAEVSYE